MDNWQCVAGLLEVGAELVVQLVFDGLDVDVGEDVTNLFGLQTRSNHSSDTAIFTAVYDNRVDRREEPITVDEAIDAKERWDEND